MIKVSVLYPNNDGATFDMDYYARRTCRWSATCAARPLKGMGAERGLAGGPGAPAPYIASGYLLFDTIEDFQGSFGPHTEKIMADTPDYTPVQPVVQISEITV